MRAGYLYLQTHGDQSDQVRVLNSTCSPTIGDGQEDATIPYVARFDDIDAAKMHFHNTLRHQLADVDAGLYRTTLPEAIAAIESIELPYRRIRLDPALGTTTIQRVESITQLHRRRHRRNDMIWRMIGAIAIFLLLLKAASTP